MTASQTNDTALTLRQKIGQTMMFGFHGTEPSPEIERLIREHHVGGVILFARNIGGPDDVLKLTVALQKIAYEAGHAHPLFISIDQENGIVRRLGAGTTLLPGNMAVGATGSPDNARAVARATGRELKALGINYNLAPVLDVNNNPSNPVIGVRSYGEDPHFVADCGVEAIKGLQEAGVPACGKHFPGHGDTSKDSHLTLPTIPHDRKRLFEVEMVPFLKAIAHGVDSIMIAHVCFPEIEPDVTKSATLSKRVVTDLLRGELGYKGLITTDCMEMHAISKTIGTVEGVCQAFQAGIDLAFVSHSHDLQEATIRRIAEAIESGEIPASRLDESAERVLDLKRNYLSWDEITPYFGQETITVPSLVNGEEHQSLARRVMESAVTLTKNDGGLLPLAISADQSVGVVYLKNIMTSMVEDERYLINSLAQAVEAVHQNAQTFEVGNPPTDEEIERVAGQLSDCAAVIVGTMNAQLSPQQVALVKRLHQLPQPLVVVSMRTPYDLAAFPEVAAHISAYEFTPVAAEIAVQGIFGRTDLQGRLPVSIPGVAQRGGKAEARA
ncbi:beta-N-acetylhexosaminidase [Tumebacillus sp. DT12]|uniref:Beta-N-acetylhexosaminidase n=1 Tax=Tumebacillus lacus TaxID=2995335 RepID=A0ABT3X284_9BACL|nr:beta-N-acetylhexosaminidase [Tumebacillus lacus]MCX7568819.1 beta-N-acetylhexosaminidase [Tumebacillus lacus]